jgi:UTP---glucose-1-phosphate uridylyltransferase
MNKPHPLQKKIDELDQLLDSLQKKNSYEEKIKVLVNYPVVKNYFSNYSTWPFIGIERTPEIECAIQSVIAIDQGPLVFGNELDQKSNSSEFLSLLEQLLDIQAFYQHMGGIIGYHVSVLKLIVGSKENEIVRYHRPQGLDLENEKNTEINQVIRWGIENLDKLAVLCPLGGAGDRLNLVDQETGEPLPAALLPFLGKTLLEGLVRDIHALEYLYFTLYGKKILTPIAIMTSVEKNNHVHMLKICKENDWFGRPSESFFFFMQPLVPVVTSSGDWSLHAPFELRLKPSGHGVLWKLANDHGVFDWFESLGRRQFLVRQVNNPIAGTDQSILALLGIGFHQRKAFGFVSCERLLKSEEGMNVFVEKEKKGRKVCCITNVEYTNFSQQGIEDIPAVPGGCFSFYPANTNILFGDISAIKEVISVNPIPGQIVNMKSTISIIDSDGKEKSIPAGRLESTMQNIADDITDDISPYASVERQNALKTFIVYNKRSKTISTTKKSYRQNESALGTPEQAYFDLLYNHSILLEKCGWTLPPQHSLEKMISEGPSFIFLFHPALGPLYNVIAQKMKGGHLTKGAEFQLELAEAYIENLFLEGSLLIEGKHDSGSRCYLRNVRIRNRGIDHSSVKEYWKNNFLRTEAVKVFLNEGSEFYAENVSIQGSYTFEVPPHHRLELIPLSEGEWEIKLTPISAPSWHWESTFNSNNDVALRLSMEAS